MEKEYILQGLCCPNCGNKIETAVKSLKGISSVSLNMITTTLKLHTDETYKGDLYNDINKIVHTYESDVIVYEKGSEELKNHTQTNSNKKEIIQLGLGAFAFCLGMFILSNESNIRFYVFLASYIILGWEVVFKALKNIVKGSLFDENFLMSIATIGAFAIGEYPEAAGVMLFYQIGELFQRISVRNSKKSIMSLMDIRPDYANIIVNGEITKVLPQTVSIGDLVVVKAGEKIPLDGIVVEGSSTIDTRAITGEFIPRKVRQNDLVISGCVNQSGLITIKVTKIFTESTVAKIIDLVENSAIRKAPTENLITTFSKYYTPVVVIVATILATIPPLFFNGDWTSWINRGLVFLVISCPCALVISIPLGFFAGIGNASKKGILVKGGNYLEALNKLDVVVFDKTGTLTKGVFQVIDVKPEEDYTEDELLSIAVKAEYFSNHPIALSIQKYFNKEINKDSLAGYTEIAGQGISVMDGNKNILAGNEKLMKTNGITFKEYEGIGTKVYFALDFKYIGSITISDEIKKDSKSTIEGLRLRGVQHIAMLTGDNVEVATEIGKAISLDEVYANLLPHQKVEKLEYLYSRKKENCKLAFVGDGINDAPVLARADIGIAMGALGSDAAIEAADIVLMTDEPQKIVEAIDIAKYTKKIVWQNIVFALGVKFIFLILGAFGIAGMWEAVFADVGVTVLAILNSMRVLSK